MIQRQQKEAKVSQPGWQEDRAYKSKWEVSDLCCDTTRSSSSILRSRAKYFYISNYQSVFTSHYVVLLYSASHPHMQSLTSEA